MTQQVGAPAIQQARTLPILGHSASVVAPSTRLTASALNAHRVAGWSEEAHLCAFGTGDGEQAVDGSGTVRSTPRTLESPKWCRHSAAAEEKGKDEKGMEEKGK